MDLLGGWESEVPGYRYSSVGTSGVEKKNRGEGGGRGRDGEEEVSN